jgi:hypothetical protein
MQLPTWVVLSRKERGLKSKRFWKKDQRMDVVTATPMISIFLFLSTHTFGVPKKHCILPENNHV